MEAEHEETYLYEPSSFPLWVWGILLSLIFILFVVGIYYASGASGIKPQVSTKQFQVTGGIMNTPGAV